MSFLRQIALPPLTCQKTTFGTESVCIYTLNPIWKPFLGKLVSRLQKKHSFLLLDDAVHAYLKLYREPSHTALFYERFPEILSCFCGGRFIRPAVISMEPDERLLPLLEAFSRHAKAVTVCTADSQWFESVSLEALHRWGLSLNERKPDTAGEADLTVILSLGERKLTLQNPVIDLSHTPGVQWENCLVDYSNEAASELLLRFPQIRLKHCFLSSKNENIRNLIWKIQKKS